MSIPRHFLQRGRRKLAPPPHANQTERDPDPTPGDEPTADDPTTAPTEPPAPVPAPAPEPTPVAAPTWNAGMRKAELLSVAQGLGLQVTEENTKAEIVAALEAAQG